ncbi:hypothetical protein Tco_1468857, partial [Tanacetum coccineum]
MSMAQQQMASKTCAAGEHMPPVIHCDLKSLNLPVDKKWTVKISASYLQQLMRMKSNNYNAAMRGGKMDGPDILGKGSKG